MVRAVLFASALMVSATASTLVPNLAQASAPQGEVWWTICSPSSPGWMQCTEYGANFVVLRQYLIRDDSDHEYIF